MTVTQCTCCFYRSTGARSSTSPHHCCYNWVLHVCLLPGGLMLKPLTKVSASITLIMAGSHYLPLKPSVTWFLLVKHSLSCLKNFNLFSSQAAFAVTELRQGKGQEVTQLEMFCAAIGAGWDGICSYTLQHHQPFRSPHLFMRSETISKLPTYLVDLSKRGSGTTHRHSSSAAFIKQSSRGPFSTGAQKPAWRFLPLQWSPRRFVPPQLCPALSVPMGCAWFSRVAGTFGWSWARRYPLGYVLVVCGRTSLVRAAVIQK